MVVCDLNALNPSLFPLLTMGQGNSGKIGQVTAQQGGIEIQFFS